MTLDISWHFFTFDISWFLMFHNICHFMTSDISWHLKFDISWHLTFDISLHLAFHYNTFDISCHLTFHSIWHFMTFEFWHFMTFGNPTGPFESLLVCFISPYNDLEQSELWVVGQMGWMVISGYYRVIKSNCNKQYLSDEPKNCKKLPNPMIFRKLLCGGFGILMS